MWLASFRVDRMESAERIDEPVDDYEHRDFNIVEYTQQNFGMHSDATITAILAFDVSLVSTALDHFGSDVVLIDNENG